MVLEVQMQDVRLSPNSVADFGFGGDPNAIVLHSGELWHEPSNSVDPAPRTVVVGSTHIVARDALFAVMLEADGTAFIVAVTGRLTLRSPDGQYCELESMGAMALSPDGAISGPIRTSLEELAGDDWVGSNLRRSASDHLNRVGSSEPAYDAGELDSYLHHLERAGATSSATLGRLESQSDRIDAQLQVIAAAEQELLGIITRLPMADVAADQSPLAELATQRARAHVNEAHRGALGILQVARKDLSELYDKHLRAPDDPGADSEVTAINGGQEDLKNHDLVRRSSYGATSADAYIEAALSQLKWYESLIVQARARLEASQQKLGSDVPVELVKPGLARTVDAPNRGSTPPDVVLARARKAAADIVENAREAVDAMYDQAERDLVSVGRTG
jgi:hypothetical protein